MKNAKILFVDDEQKILDSMRRNLRKYNITTCNAPLEALKMVQQAARTGHPFAVVVSDYKMPKMSGLEFLIGVKGLSPNTVRVMLTGYSDNDTAIRAINEGSIFRFLTKPISTPQIVMVLNLCIEQYRLVIAEKELLRGTLSGSIKVLTEVLSQSNHEAFGMGERVKRTVKTLLKDLDLSNKWQIEIAAMLSQIGLTAIPADIITKVKNKEELKPFEEELYNKYPEIGAKLIANIPRLEPVSEFIKYQKRIHESSAPFGSKVINLALRFDEMLYQGVDPTVIIKTISKDEAIYGPTLIKTLENILKTTNFDHNTIALNISELKEGMIVNQDVFTNDNLLLISRGQEITNTALMRLYNYKESCGIKEPIVIINQSEPPVTSE